MPTRNQNIVSLSRLSALLLLVALLLVNVLAARSNVRIDLTEEGLYTLTDASSSVLDSLEDPATVKVFWHNVPAAWETDRRYVDSLLREMKAVAGGKLVVRWVDLESDDGKKEAEDAGIQVMHFEEHKEGEARATAGYNALLIEVGDETETINQLANVGPRLEYEIISRLHKMTATEDVVVGLVAPRPPMNPFAGAQTGRFNALEFQLRRRYGANLRSHLSLAEPVPPDVDVLLVVAPKDIEHEEVYHFEQFLLRGGRAMLLADPVHAALGQAPPGDADSTGFEEWLAHLGITIESGVIGDLGAFQNRPRVVQTAIGRVIEWVGYPYWPLLRAPHMDEENPATRGFDQVPLYWPAALSVDEAKQVEAGRTVTELGTTTESGWRRHDLIGLGHAEEDPFRKEDLEAGIPLILLIEGPMTSFWKGRPAPGEEDEGEAGEVEEGASEEASEGADEAPEPPLPGEETPEDAEVEAGDEEESPSGETPSDTEPPGEDADGDAPEDGSEEASGEEPDEEDEGPRRLDAGEGVLVIFTDAELVDDDVSRIARGYGLVFVMNMLDWLSGTEDLLALRARTPKARTLDPVEPAEQKLFQWIDMLGIPLLVFFAGIVVWIVRRYQR